MLSHAAAAELYKGSKFGLGFIDPSRDILNI
jgi:hypothetical protein